MAIKGNHPKKRKIVGPRRPARKNLPPCLGGTALASQRKKKKEKGGWGFVFRPPWRTFHWKALTPLRKRNQRGKAHP